VIDLLELCRVKIDIHTPFIILYLMQ